MLLGEKAEVTWGPTSTLCFSSEADKVLAPRDVHPFDLSTTLTLNQDSLFRYTDYRNSAMLSAQLHKGRN